MTRREQIDAQAKSLVEEFAKEQGIDPKEVQELGLWFKLGCYWADKNPNGSRIKWQTGEPKESGSYLISIKGKYSHYVTCAMYNCLTEWSHWEKEEIDAWCKLSDIEPYKEKED